MFSLGELRLRESSADIKLISFCRSSSLGFVSNENPSKTSAGNGIRIMLIGNFWIGSLL